MVAYLQRAPAVRRAKSASAVGGRRRTGRCWRKRAWLALGTLAIIASAPAIAADAASETGVQHAGAGDPVAGKLKSDSERCQECHGQDGNAEDSRIPKHAGQFAGYLVKQLQDFQSGARRHEIMVKMAADLTPADMADIAAYFAGQPVMHGRLEHENPRAKNLFESGDPARELASCESCHGKNGKGRVENGVIYPVIGGQNKLYLRRQLLNWKLGERKNSAEAVMNKVAKALADDEIEALVDYVSGL